LDHTFLSFNYFFIILEKRKKKEGKKKKKKILDIINKGEKFFIFSNKEIISMKSSPNDQ